ncbi:MAG: CBS domain-containing protein [Rhodospirillaceae bacterium]|nr:CBS domain-containing protein [Rhodospirillaceae bacterium]
MTRTIGDIMATELLTFTPETSIHKAIHLLLEKRFSGAPVINAEGKIVGVLSKKDCLKIVFSTGYHHDHGGQVSEYMSTKVETLDANTGLIEAAEHFIKSSFRRFPVVRGGKMVGQISRHDVLRSLIEESAARPDL